MPEYRRLYLANATVFLTLVTYKRQPIFNNPKNISRLRKATAQVLREKPFDIIGAVVLPDHIHFLWTLPLEDNNYSQRVSGLKVLFTWSLRGRGNKPQNISPSRRKHRESDVWQRRFWEHTIRNEMDLEKHLEYIHYNPVKHGLVTCPHLWSYSSFHQWVKQGKYEWDWACICGKKNHQVPYFKGIVTQFGE